MKYTDFFKEWSSLGQMFSAPQPDPEKYDVDPGGPEKEDEKLPRRTINIPEADGPCWSGYEMVGFKMKDGKRVPNCVPIKEVEGGLSKGMSVASVAEKHGVSVEEIKAQLKTGVEVEKEHTDDNVEAAKIALDHLVEDPLYYTKLQKMETENLDPVGQEDDDIDNDGDSDASDEYLKKKRNAISKAMETEEFCPACLAEVLRGEHPDMLGEAEYQGRKVALGKPMRGDVKKFKVYVKNKNGNVIKVNFGDPNMKIKKNIPGRRKSFRARHRCDTAKDRTTARYWSCRAW